MFDQMEEIEELEYHLTYVLFSIYQNPYFSLMQTPMIAGLCFFFFFFLVMEEKMFNHCILQAS